MTGLRLTSLLVVLALGAACGADRTPAPPASSDLSRTTGPAPTGAGTSPTAYRRLNLPEIEGGSVVDAGRQAASLRDGLAITVITSQAVDSARAFYMERLTAGGWTSAPQGRGAMVPNLPAAMLNFTRDTLTFTATITALADGTRIDLRVLER